MCKTQMKKPSSEAMRKNTVVILSSIKGQRAIHFTEQPLAGRDHNVWFPIGNEDLFRAIENIMVINNQACNLTLVRCIRDISDICHDYDVTYNATTEMSKKLSTESRCWSSLQLSILAAYGEGDFSHITPGLENCGDGLLRFLMTECSEKEDCLSLKDTTQRIAVAVRQLCEVSDYLEQI
ncbi:MAG TPA: hypothetical protein ENI98_10075 [Gammaproteobacteria bacterium]|nr:hypothetical protein [Gammaproteobacteria bacterium]